MKRNFFSKVFQASLLCCLAVLFTACEEFGMESNPTPSYLSLNTDDVTLKVGGTLVRKAIVAGTAVVIYTSSNEAVATVDQDGKVTAVGEGTATITAQATGYDAAGKKIYQPASVSYVVTVTPGAVPVTSITLNETNLNKKVGDAAVTLTATVAPDDATDKTVTWESSNTSVATVADGVVTFVGAGTATITATATNGTADTADDKSATCAVTVTVTIDGLLAGKFSVSATKQVYFSKGNLQAVIAGLDPADSNNKCYTASTWKFAENQYDCIGDAAGNTSFATTTTVDLFGWVGASATYNTYGLCTKTPAYNDYYGTAYSEALKTDWGKLAISNGGNTANYGWRTLTMDEWEYLFKTRTASTINGIANGRFAKATVAGKAGIILFPDSYTHPTGVTNPNSMSVNDPGAGYSLNIYDATDWGKMQTAGAVFLPAAGKREGTTIYSAGLVGLYWSSTVKDDTFSKYLDFGGSGIYYPSSGRFLGMSVRLVMNAE
jgi:uncharacterized protein YjdB